MNITIPGILIDSLVTVVLNCAPGAQLTGRLRALPGSVVVLSDVKDHMQGAQIAIPMQSVLYIVWSV